MDVCGQVFGVTISVPFSGIIVQESSGRVHGDSMFRFLRSMDFPRAAGATPLSSGTPRRERGVLSLQMPGDEALGPITAAPALIGAGGWHWAHGCLCTISENASTARRAQHLPGVSQHYYENTFHPGFLRRSGAPPGFRDHPLRTAVNIT